ncbi:hypothetical protein [Roseovarius aestuariivivens]|uniref:hypothetical protein n=1 Tax=Roseovarius aestuariivivens TaxID=1888910 RepID=UPI001080D595|nr:hypothetical protein [Roseovarius aestuariivivens]
MIRKLLFVSLGVAAVTLAAEDAQASTVTLDFDTAATGSNIVSDGSVSTSLGTVSLSCTGTCLNLTSNGGNGFLRHNQGTDADFAELTFGFSATSLSLVYAGDISGVFTAQAIDRNGNVVDSFFDDNTVGALGDDVPGGTVNLFGTDIVAFRFFDGPGGLSFASIDDLAITVAPIPLPTGLPLLAGGFMLLGLLRRRKA